MWFIGALVGAGFGGMLGGGTGAAALGAVLGGVIGWLAAGGNSKRIDELSARVTVLEERMRGGIAPTPAPTPEPEPQPQPRPEPTPYVAPASTAASEERPAEPQPSAPEQVPEPVEPEGPSLWERLVGGNLVAKVGIVILFFGVAFLLRYAYERIHVPIELRLLGVAAGGIVLLVIGWLLRATRPGYALALQGGGIGVLYLVIFGAFRLFGLLPAPLAFGLLVGVAAFSAVLAVVQNSLAFAALGISGGFLAPVLASTGQGNHVMLFSYYAVLNGAILAIAWARAWRVLNLLGFGFTFVIGLLWGSRAYRPEYFSTTEPFLILFFLIYVAIPLLFARQRAVALKDYVDGTLVFGVPVVAFGLQTALVRGIEFGAAWSALALAAFYLALAYALIRRSNGSLRLLGEANLALAVAFATLAIPLAFEGRLTSAAWALEGAAVVWIGVRQGRLLARAFGYLLQFAAGVAFLFDVSKGYGATPVLNSFYLGCLFIAAGALFCAWYIERNRAQLGDAERSLAPVLLIWGALWWFGGGLHEISRHVTDPRQTQVMLLFFTGSALAASLGARALAWPALRWLWLTLYAGVLLQLGVDLILNEHPLVRLGALAWGAAIAAHFYLLWRHGEEQPGLGTALHAFGVWLLALLGARELGWLIDQAVEGKRVWPAISWALAPALILYALSLDALRGRWPLVSNARAYVVVGGTPLAVFLALWLLYANFTNNGDPHPLPFVPLLNPLDLAMAAVIVLLARWMVALRREGLEQWWQGARNVVFALFGLAGFVWINGTLLRTLHHWADLPFALQPMLQSRLVQSSFSILWTLLALGAMVVATRRGLRPVWIIGAGLMAAVVGKLFLVDLSGIGTIERIVSFIGVGLLMLVVGYLSPVPPKEVR